MIRDPEMYLALDMCCVRLNVLQDCDKARRNIPDTIKIVVTNDVFVRIQEFESPVSVEELLLVENGVICIRSRDVWLSKVTTATRVPVPIGLEAFAAKESAAWSARRHDLGTWAFGPVRRVPDLPREGIVRYLQQYFSDDWPRLSAQPLRVQRRFVWQHQGGELTHYADGWAAYDAATQQGFVREGSFHKMEWMALEYVMRKTIREVKCVA